MEKKEDDILYLDVDEFFKGKDINVNISDDDTKKEEKNEKGEK